MVVVRDICADTFDPYQRFRSLVPSQRVRELSVLRPGRAVLDCAHCWAWIIAAWALVAWRPAWWTVLLALPIVGTRYYALFIIGHDGMHRRIFNDRALNDLFGDLFIWGPVGAITRLNCNNHMLHHRLLARPSDPDRHKYCCVNKAVWTTLLGYLTGLTSGLQTVKNVFLHGDRPETAVEPREKTAGGYTARDRTILVAWQLALVGGLTWAIGWWAWPVLWLAPVFIFTFLGDNARSFAEHSHPESDAKADQHRLITYSSNPIERCFFAPMNMNYHAAHHLWTSIPYYNLPAADRELRDSSATDGLVWRRSYVGYLLRYALALPLEECLEPASADAHGLAAHGSETHAA